MGRIISKSESKYDELLSNIKLNKKEKALIIARNGAKIIYDNILGYFDELKLIKVFVDFGLACKEDIDKVLETKLLKEYFDIVDEKLEVVNELKLFLDDVYGNALYGKLLSILKNNLPNEEYCKKLANLLKKIIKEGKYEELFEEHSYYLSLLSELTPQELLIIGDYKNYPLFFPEYDYNDSNGRLLSDWAPVFAEEYVKKRKVGKNTNLVVATIISLARKGYLIGYYKDKGDICILENTIQHLAEYILEYEEN